MNRKRPKASTRSKAKDTNRRSAPTESARSKPRPTRTSDREEGKGERLNKRIAEAGVTSRRKADELIEAGRVQINGRVVVDLGTRVFRHDDIDVDGVRISSHTRRRYILLNKPKDTISTVSDERGRRTVLDIVGLDRRLYPVGRLDRNTTGVLLLTNDGDLAFRMTHPKFGIERVYRARLDRPLSGAHARSISEGLDIGRGERSSPCEVAIVSEKGTEVELRMTEGKNREVRRIFESLGYSVRRLDRRSYAGLTARGLPRGGSRDLTAAEVRELRRRVGVDSQKGGESRR